MGNPLHANSSARDKAYTISEIKIAPVAPWWRQTCEQIDPACCIVTVAYGHCILSYDFAPSCAPGLRALSPITVRADVHI